MFVVAACYLSIGMRMNSSANITLRACYSAISTDYNSIPKPLYCETLNRRKVVCYKSILGKRTELHHEEENYE
ncbi:unnamed protein product [Amoebophrya sp. A25]|nr:unnamed protein product [Amoebophrya sp. A25]|eukprot:GSA25T00005305001.1